jgi:hypothetical protein
MKVEEGPAVRKQDLNNEDMWKDGALLGLSDLGVLV